jgi:hypothetical protein
VLVPLELDPIAVANDDGFRDRVAGQRNVSDELKKELVAFYA